MKLVGLTLIIVIALLPSLGGAVATGPKTICPTDILSFGEFATQIPFKLAPHERLTTKLHFAEDDLMVVAGVTGWEKRILSHSRLETRKHGVIAVSPISLEEMFSNRELGTHINSIFSLPGRPDVIGFNWGGGAVGIVELETGNTLVGIKPDLGKRFGQEKVFLPARDVSVFPDGNRLLATYPTGDAFVFDTASGRELLHIAQDDPRPNAENVFDAKVSHDGRFIVSAHKWAHLWIRNSATGKSVGSARIPTCDASEDPPVIRMSEHGPEFEVTTVGSVLGYGVGFHRTQMYYRLLGDGQVELMGKFEDRAEDLKLWGIGWAYEPPIAFGSHGTLLRGTHEGNVAVYDLENNLSMNEPALLLKEGHKSPVISVASSHDAHTFASGSEDGTITVWNNNGPRSKHYQFTDNPLAVVGLTFSSDDRYLIVEVLDHVNAYPLGKRNADVTQAFRIDLQDFR